MVPSQGPTPAREHIVQFWSDDDFLLDHLEDSISSAIEGGDAFICIATKMHARGLAKRHSRDMAIAIEQGRYIALNAAQVLSAVMPEGKFEEATYFEFFRSAIQKARNAIGPKSSRVTIFGEVIAMLWSRGNREDAIRWEQSWNTLVRANAISLCCGYPMQDLGLRRDKDYFQMICAEHSAVTLPAGLPSMPGKERPGHKKTELKQVLRQAQLLSQGGRTRLSQWQKHYRAVLLETDRNQLFKAVEVAEAAVLTELQALPSEKDNMAERSQIMHAWSGLQMIKKRKLRFP